MTMYNYLSNMYMGFKKKFERKKLSLVNTHTFTLTLTQVKERRGKSLGLWGTRFFVKPCNI